MRLILALAAHFKPTNLQQNPNTAGGVYSNQKTASSYSALPNNKNTMSSNKNFAQSANNICLQTLQASTISQNTTKNNLNQTRTLDSMTHLVQAACVSLADVRRYGNGEKNFNVKYVKRNNLKTLENKKAGTMPPPAQPLKFTSPTRTSSNHVSNQMTVTSNVNNQTYVTHNSLAASPLRSDQYKPFVRSNLSSESSFSSSTIMSPTCQRPLANSTVLNMTNNINCSIEHVRNSESDKFFNKNRTHVIETPNENSNIQSQMVLPVSTNDSASMKDQNENNNDGSKNASTKNSIVNNATVLISDKSDCKNKEAIEQIEKNLQHEKEQRLEETEANLEEVTATKKLLLSLQTLLMNANLDDLLTSEDQNVSDDKKIIENREPDITPTTDNNNPDDSNSSDDYALSGLTPEEQITILRSKIQQLEILCSDLRVELNQHNFVSMHKVGEGRGLKSRVNEQDNTILEMKNEQLSLHMTNQQLIQEISDLKKQLEVQVDLNKTLKNNLAFKDEAFEKLKQQMVDEKKKENPNDLNNSYSNSMEKENILTEIRSNKELANKSDATFIIPKQTSFNNSNTNSNNNNNISHKKVINTEADRILYEAMNQVRRNNKSTHATQFLLDALEKEIKMINEKIIDDKSEFLKFNPEIAEKTVQISESACGSSSTSVSTSNSSSLTSSSANSPVLSANSISSSNNNFLPNSLPGVCLANVTHPQHTLTSQLTKQTSLESNNLCSIEKQQINTHSNLKRSTDSIIGLQSQQICSNSREKLKELSKYSNSNNKSIQNQQNIVQNEGHVKKIVSRFQQVGQSIKIERNDSEDNRFISSSDILPLSKFNAADSNKNISNNNLLTIFSTNSSTCSNEHSPNVYSSMSSSSQENSSKKIFSTTSTKCIYYIHKESQPYCVTLFKKIDSITLQDFKDNVKLNPSSKYRFFFKTQEPEFGYLKEEISCNETILPCFDNRIIAWIEESH